MTDEEIIRIARDFRDGMLEDRPSDRMCAMVSLPLAGMLSYFGLPCECESAEFEWGNHVWIRLADGRVLDATADQFPDFPPVYLGEAREIHGA